MKQKNSVLYCIAVLYCCIDASGDCNKLYIIFCAFLSFHNNNLINKDEPCVVEHECGRIY